MWKQLSTAYQSMYLDEAMKYTHAVIDPDGNVLGFTSNQKDATSMSKNNLRKVKGKVVALKKPMAPKKGDMMVGRPLKENLDEKTKIEFKPNPSDSNKTMIMKKGKEMGNIIKTNKGFQVMQFDKPAGKVFKSLNDIKPAIRKMYGEAVNPNCDCVDCNCDPCECGDWREGMGPEGGGHKTSDAESLGEETLEELTSAEKKLIDKMYDKKGNLTPIGKAVMDAGKMRGKSPSQMGVLTKKK